MSRIWSQEDDEALRGLYGTSSMRTMTRCLCRSSWAIRLRARRMGLRICDNGEGVTMADLARCLGVAATSVRRWVREDGLRAKAVWLTEDRAIYKISITAFWRWAAQHKERIDWTKIEPNVLPPEPAWVQPLRLAGEGRDKYARRKATTQDVERIRALRDRGMTRKEIAAATGRSEGSVAYISRQYLTER